MNFIDHFILFLAEPFGFGPISSSITLARQIKILSPGNKCIFMGSGTSFQLASKSEVFDEIYFLDKLCKTYFNEHKINFNKNNCTIIANTYPDAVEFANQLDINCIFIDTIFWMWPKLPIDINNVEKYYIEDFFCTNINIHKFGYSNKFKAIPPLIDIDAKPKKIPHPFLLVGLGGIESNFYGFPMFFEKLIKYIGEERELKKFNIAICGGGKKFLEGEFKKYENSKLTISTLGHDEYIGYLKSADLVLSSPGLHGFYENYYLKKNVMFIPPISYSQYLQLNYIKRSFSRVLGVNFEEMGINHNLQENMQESIRVQEMKRLNQFLYDSDEAMKFFINQFERFYKREISTNWLCDTKMQFENDIKGPVFLAKEILSFICSKQNLV